MTTIKMLVTTDIDSIRVFEQTPVITFREYQTGIIPYYLNITVFFCKIKYSLFTETALIHFAWQKI